MFMSWLGPCSSAAGAAKEAGESKAGASKPKQAKAEAPTVGVLAHRAVSIS